MKLMVFYDGQYWIGIAEDERNGKLLAARHIFGTEPLDGEVLDFVRHDLLRLFENVGKGVRAAPTTERRVNPKRLARLASRELAQKGPSTTAQAAIQADLEYRKKVRKTLSREEREADAARKREIARQKAKDKHRGR
ncbi:YjdF family protein [Paenibacillus chitinolyticus]|uniref:YjdF family protein n=1 Tax=Paenibacillus chitinolyticus TaxID=79263 RepID=UPI00366D145A